MKVLNPTIEMKKSKANLYTFKKFSFWRYYAQQWRILVNARKCEQAT